VLILSKGIALYNVFRDDPFLYSLAILSAVRQWQFTQAVPLLTDPSAIANGHDAAHQETLNRTDECQAIADIKHTALKC
jgi:hypothetical protein